MKRSLSVVLLPLVLALGPVSVLGPACAKKGSTTSGGSLANNIEMTGVESFDAVFREVRDVDEKLDAARVSLRSGRDGLNSALGLRKGTPFTDAVGELQQRADGKLQVVLDGGSPKLAVSDAVPGNVQAAVDSANKSLGDYTTALSDLTAIRDDLDRLVSAAESFPMQVKEDAGSLGLRLSELPAIASTLNHNLGLMENFPNRIEKLTGELSANLAVVTSLQSDGAAPVQGDDTKADENAGKPTALPR